MVVQRAGQWPAAGQPRGDGGGQGAGVTQRVGVHALICGELPVPDQAAAGVETHPAGRRRARRRQLAQKAPPVQQRRARDLKLMRGDGVTGKRNPVHRQHPKPLPGEQHRGGRTG